jgi:hypothetical protein
MADALNLANCTTSRAEIVGSRGGSRDDVFDALEQENQSEAVKSQDARNPPKQLTQIENAPKESPQGQGP